MRNPFTPSFGSVPAVMAGRDDIVQAIVEAMENGPGDPNLSTIIVGARGTGKTALLGRLSVEAGEIGWVSANASSLPGMLEDIYIQAAKAEASIIEGKPKTRVRGLSIAPLGSIELERAGESPANFRSKMEDIIEQLEEKGSGLMITIDEVRPDLEEMIQFASIYQHFVREGRKVALVMAGLPSQVSSLLSNESVSFLRRAKRHHFGRVPDADISMAINQTVRQGGRKIEAKALEKATNGAGGFPYLMQLIGYEMWRQSPNDDDISENDADIAIVNATKEMGIQIFDATYRDLSAKDVQFIMAMAEDEEESRLSDIAERMGVKSNYASEYKSRLIEAGVIYEVSRGVLRFDIPGFREYIQEKKHEHTQ